MLEVTGSAKLRFRLLGEAALDGESGGLRISSQKGFALLIYLAMNRGRSLNRAVIADLLWGDRGDASARQNLRQAIHTLRRDLGPMHSSILRLEDQTIALAADAIEVDALQFAAWVQDSHPATRARCLEIPWGPFLQGFSVDTEPFDEWVQTERHRLDALATRTFSDLAKSCDDAGDGPRAILAMERLIAIDPGEEERHRRLLSLEARYRGADAALARAKTLAAMLKRDLDAEPEPATLALVREIRASAARKPNSVGPAASVTPFEPGSRPDVAAADVAAAAPRRSYWRYAVAAVGLLLVGSAVVSLVQRNVAGVPQRELATQTPAEPGGHAVERSWQSPQLPVQPGGSSIARERGLVAIAVLPIRPYGDSSTGANLLTEMMTEDLTHLLSRVPALRVISRQTTMSYRGQNVDVAKAGAELGVSYLIEGSAGLSDNTLRVNVALIDTRTRLQVWSRRFERTGSDRSEIQSEILKSVARELGISVVAGEATYASNNPDIHALIFQGYAAIHAGRHQGVDGLRPAEQYFQRALDRDPDAVRAKIGLGLFHAHMAVQLFAPDPAPHLAKAEEILQAIANRHPELSEPHGGMGLVHTARNQSEKALASFARAIELNPSDAPSYAQTGRTLVRLGREKEGLEHILYAMRLSPRDPGIGYWQAFAGYAELELGNFESAVAYLARAHELNPTQPRTLLSLISANMWAGRAQIAREQLGQLQKQHPHLSHERLRKMYGGAQNRKNAAGILRALEQDGPTSTTANSWQSPPLPSARKAGSKGNQEKGITPIIVLPFQAYDDEPSIRLMADMMTGDVINVLSRARHFRVISRQTANQYRAQNVDVLAKAHELGVRYVLDGTIRSHRDKLRVTVELIHVPTRDVAWSAHIDREQGNGQGIVDAIVRRLVRELQIETFSIEGARLPDDSGTAALVYRGMAALFASFSNIDIESYRKAEALFLQALELNPKSVGARLGLGSFHANVAVQRLVPDVDSHLRKAFDLISEVIRERPMIGGAHHQMGIILQNTGKLEEAIASFERALELNPSSAGSHAHIGFALARMGRAKDGIEHIRYAMRLSPRDPSMAIWLEFAGTAELELDRYQDAIANFRRSIALSPAYPRPWAGLVAAHALAGESDAARACVEKLKTLAPDLSAEQLIQRFGRGKVAPRLREGLRIALTSAAPAVTSQRP